MASRSGEVILPLYSALPSPHPETCIQLWNPQHNKDVDLMDQVQKATKKVRDLKQLSYEDRLEVWAVQPGVVKALGTPFSA